MRRIIYSIGEGLLVIALFTAALSAQKAATVAGARAAAAAPSGMQSESVNTSFPEWLNIDSSDSRAFPM